MSTLHSSERIGEAWRMHRDGNNDQAIKIFKEIIQTAPESVDAYYGLRVVISKPVAIWHQPQMLSKKHLI